MIAKPRVLVSACLLGDAVRFDGGHRRSAFVTSLGAHVEVVRVCPEVDAGLGTPRPSMRLVSDGRLRMLSRAGADVTEAVQQSCARIADRVLELDGALLKKGSPSCGPDRVKVYGTNGMPLRSGRGLLVEELARRQPHVPIEDEGRLEDADLRHSFLARLFAHARLRHLFGEGFSLRALVEFHSKHKLLLMAHSPRVYRELGQLVAQAADLDRPELRRTYVGGVMDALSHPITRGRHTNVLQHIAGYVSREIDAASRQEIQQVISQFRAGLQPLAAPRVLLAHHIRQHGVSYIRQQRYLDPYPAGI